MNILTKKLVTLCLGLASGNIAVANTSKGVDAQKYFKDKQVLIYEEPVDYRSNAWLATPRTVMSFNQKTKRPDIISVWVEGEGYSVEFADLVVLNCSKPTASYIDRGKRGKISLKDSMANGSYLGDVDYDNHIDKNAVKALYKRYCK